LRAQLAMQPGSPVQELAIRILSGHIDLLATHDTAALATALDADMSRVHAAVALILSLRAYPVEPPTELEDLHIVPDVVAWHAGGAWRVALNRRTTPRIRIAPH